MELSSYGGFIVPAKCCIKCSQSFFVWTISFDLHTVGGPDTGVLRLKKYCWGTTYSCSFVCKLYRLLVGKPEGKNHLEDPGIDGWIILRWIFRKWDVGVWTGSIWLRIGEVVGSCECGNERSGSINCGKFLD